MTMTAAQLEAALAEYFAPWVQALGLKVEAVGDASVTLRLPASAQLSRVGGTVCGQAMFLGATKRAAAEFSFFLAIPIMVGAFVLDIWESRDFLTADNLGIIGVGFIASFVFGLIVVKLMLDFVPNHVALDHPWVDAHPEFFIQGTAAEMAAAEGLVSVHFVNASGSVLVARALSVRLYIFWSA